MRPDSFGSYIVTRGIRGMAKLSPLTRFCETPCVLRIWQKVSQVQNVQYVKKKMLSTKEGLLIGKQKQGIEPRKNFTVRLSETEREQVTREADYYGMKESEYVRELITHGGMVDTSLAEDRRNLINQISRIGNNYNQIVRIANGCGYITNSTMQKCNELFAEIKEAFQEVMRRWR